ncbi:MAG: Rpn family recombination-promoting nuclease/putative transposase [Dysgonamonadaceae bacterium]|jgi:predicted transposase/invertase (TIGR01784 family)|nr:Rpn family recombination-promoting nuclease/putative transposase [Dysgonamonadaceae bacterium]
MSELEPVGKYMNLLNDFGFKYVFSKKEFLIHFLNELFREKEKIIDIEYLPTEQLGKTEADRKAIFDIFCKNDKGEYILLEMQNVPQQYFHERSIFYSSFLIQRQAEKGDWNYELKKIYVIGVLNFNLFQEEDGKYVEEAYLMRQSNNECLSEKLRFIYIELPKFNKTIEELKTPFEVWLYILKNSKKLEAQPETIKDKIFKKLFKTIEINKLTIKNMKLYQKSDLKYEDFSNFTSYAEKQGREKGKQEGIMEGRILGIMEGHQIGVREGKMQSQQAIANKLLAKGMSIDDIAQITGLSNQQIQRLK